ncbi:hypothetical protein ACFSHP_18745 [Novosphingobium panipatense]
MARADCGAGEYLRLRRFIRDRRVGALRSHFDDRSAFQEINPMVRMFDLNQHLRTLQLRLDARSSDEAQIEIKVSAEKALVRFDASVLDAALVELVDNARTALAIGGASLCEPSAWGVGYGSPLQTREKG